MYIAHSALKPAPIAIGASRKTKNRPALAAEQPQNRYQAYQTICQKYRREIADIQKYIPGWQPRFY